MTSRKHFEILSLGLESKVFGLGLEAYQSSKMPCPRSRTALFFDLLKMGKVMTCSFLRLGERQRLRGKQMKVFFFRTPETQQKIAMFWAKTFFCLFLENTCALCLWSLASRRSILGKSVLGLGLGFFLWFLDSTSDYDLRSCLIIEHRIAYSARNFVKSSFSDVRRFRNAGLPMVRSHADQIYYRG